MTAADKVAELLRLTIRYTHAAWTDLRNLPNTIDTHWADAINGSDDE